MNSLLENLEQHWYNHNRIPSKYKELFKNQLQRVSHIAPEILKQAVAVLASEEVFPKIQKLLYHCLVLSPTNDAGSVDCNICGSMGLVLGVVWVRGNSRMDIVSYKQQARPEGHYTTRVIGRCVCDNGLAYQHVKSNVMGKIVQPDQFLVDAAEKNGWDAAFEAQVAAQHYRDKSKGIERKGPGDGPLAQIIDNLIKGEANEND